MRQKLAVPQKLAAHSKIEYETTQIFGITNQQRTIGMFGVGPLANPYVQSTLYSNYYFEPFTLSLYSLNMLHLTDKGF